MVMTLSRVGMLGAVVLTLVGGFPTPRAAWGGSLKGTVVLKGTTPENNPRNI